MTQTMLDVVSDDVDQWRVDPDKAGYGATVMDLGIYPLNTARFVLDAEPVAATAMMRTEHKAFSKVPDEHAASPSSTPTGRPRRIPRARTPSCRVASASSVPRAN